MAHQILIYSEIDHARERYLYCDPKGGNYESMGVSLFKTSEEAYKKLQEIIKWDMELLSMNNYFHSETNYVSGVVVPYEKKGWKKYNTTLSQDREIRKQRLKERLACPKCHKYAVKDCFERGYYGQEELNEAGYKFGSEIVEYDKYVYTSQSL